MRLRRKTSESNSSSLVVERENWVLIHLASLEKKELYLKFYFQMLLEM